jgi:hypothetical protein
MGGSTAWFGRLARVRAVQGYPLEPHASTGDVRAKSSGGSAAGAVVPEFIFCR